MSKYSLKYLKTFGFTIWLEQIMILILNKLHILVNLKNKIRGLKNKKILKFLKKNLADVIAKYSNYKSVTSEKKSNKIWIFWYQGIKNAPDVVQQCIASIKKYNPDKEIIILDEKNITQYYKMPSYIKQNLKNGSITLTHLSDIIRMNLLKKYGGFWMDATIFFSEKLFTTKVFNQFYTIKFVDNDVASICEGKWCGFFIGGNNLEFYEFMCDLFAAYWQKYDCLIDYFLIDYFINICYENNALIKEKFDAVSLNNINIFGLQNILYLDYEKTAYQKIMSTNKVHKLSYKDVGRIDEKTLYFHLFKSKGKIK